MNIINFHNSFSWDLINIGSLSRPYLNIFSWDLFEFISQPQLILELSFYLKNRSKFYAQFNGINRSVSTMLLTLKGTQRRKKYIFYRFNWSSRMSCKYLFLDLSFLVGCGRYPPNFCSPNCRTFCLPITKHFISHSEHLFSSSLTKIGGNAVTRLHWLGLKSLFSWGPLIFQF